MHRKGKTYQNEISKISVHVKKIKFFRVKYIKPKYKTEKIFAIV